MNKLIIKLPIYLKVSLNKIWAGVHWSKRKAIADEYHGYILEHKSKIPKITEYPIRITYDFEWKGKPLDSLNTVLIAKGLEDGMRKYGILEEDDWKHVTGSTLNTAKGKQDLVTITIEPFNN